MKQFSVGFLLLAFILSAVAVPDSALAKKGGDDDHDDDARVELRGGWDDDHDDDDDRDDDDSNDDDSDNSSDDGLEVEADVFTDTTIVKVELENGRKTVFSTEADTEAEVVDVVVTKFGLSKSEVEAVIDFEVEDRASRAKDRAKLSFTNNRPIKNIVTCDNSATSTLEVEADVFTNTTIVKVELVNGTKKVFETTATTTDDIVAAVVAKVTTLSVSDVKAVLDIDVEDRASRASDFTISSSSNDDDCNDDTPSNNSTVKASAKLEAKIAELQKLVEALIKLLNSRLGN